MEDTHSLLIDTISGHVHQVRNELNDLMVIINNEAELQLSNGIGYADHRLTGLPDHYRTKLHDAVKAMAEDRRQNLLSRLEEIKAILMRDFVAAAA